MTGFLVYGIVLRRDDYCYLVQIKPPRAPPY